jgi:hypothetical protein
VSLQFTKASRSLLIRALKTFGLKDIASRIYDRFQRMKLVLFLQNVRSLIHGILVYRRTGSTPNDSFISMIFLFCKTRGRSNDILHNVLKLSRNPYDIKNPAGILGTLTKTGLKRIAHEIREKGYYVFPSLLPPDTCDALLQFALLKPCRRSTPGISTTQQVVYNREAPDAVKYYFDEDTLLESPEIQRLISDLSMIAVAQAYLEVPPILDFVAMWWSTGFSKVADEEAAQLYHFDMDRIKWLKFFVYLTDVTTENGPHCFIGGSHRQKGQPSELLSLGYARISDEEILKFYPSDSIVEFTGRKGTIFAEDTRGFHKGKPLQESDRLVFELQFSDSLFGASHPGTEVTPVQSDFVERVKEYPGIYKAFRLVSDF